MNIKTITIKEDKLNSDEFCEELQIGFTPISRIYLDTFIYHAKYLNLLLCLAQQMSSVR